MSFCGWFSGEKYKDHFEQGGLLHPITHPQTSPRIYVCSNCNNELFHSRSKYEHSSPWPAFTELIRPDSVSRRAESSTAIKIHCGKCGNGLGHEFIGDGPEQGKNRF